LIELTAPPPGEGAGDEAAKPPLREGELPESVDLRTSGARCGVLAGVPPAAYRSEGDERSKRMG
jgi:hypothetical protein